MVVRELCSIAVPLFLAISGYFISNKDINDKRTYLSFLRKQIPRVYIPCLLWSLPVTAIGVYSGLDLFTSLMKCILCSALVPYYFVLLIIQMYVLHPIIVRYARYGMYETIVVMFNLVAVAYLTYFGNPELPTAARVGPFIYWIMFYYLGAKLYNSTESKDSLKYLIPLSMFLFIAQFFETYYVGPGIKVTTWLWCYVAIRILFNKSIQRKISNTWPLLIKTLAELGRYSFGVYLAHIYIIIVANKLGLYFPWGISILLVCSLTFAIVRVADYLLPSKIVKYIGLK